MKVDLQTFKLSLSDATAGWIRTRFAFALGRFAPRIARLRVRLMDDNGPRGGLDKVCRIHVEGRGFNSFSVQSVAADLATAATRAADRAARVVARAIERRRDWRLSGGAASGGAA